MKGRRHMLETRRFEEVVFKSFVKFVGLVN